MDSASTSERDFLQLVLNKEKCDKISPEARLIVVHELIEQCRKLGVERVLKRSRIKLVWWKYISWVVAIMRMACIIALLWILWDLRYSHFDYLVVYKKIHTNLTYKMVYQGLALGIFLCIVGILAEFLLILVFQIQHSSAIAFLYAISMIIVTMIITLGPFMAGFRAHSKALISDLYAYTIAENPLDGSKIIAVHNAYNCCGFQNASDWFSESLFNVKMLMTGELKNRTNRFGWTMTSCTNRSSKEQIPIAPPFCCKVPGCYKSNIKITEGKMCSIPKVDFSFYENEIKGEYPPPYDKLFDKPCFAAITEEVDNLIDASYKWIIFLALLTIVMTALVIAILLYNYGQGELFPHLNTVRSPRYNALVWFFVKLDNNESTMKEEDLTDFSLVEELKKFDIDKDLTDME
ncbi:unnamed protein product [Cylicocyclus nassatus]|uniref:Tetraspanin n=1 Tax=Cylicocyclus nassatus TaxID=53992 RepID=A0AA36GS80_CYLNA|nr:unnamed protein product [Cylicocyclus nassatus]